MGSGEGEGKRPSELEVGHFPSALVPSPILREHRVEPRAGLSWLPTPGPGTGVVPTLAATSAERFLPQ